MKKPLFTLAAVAACFAGIALLGGAPVRAQEKAAPESPRKDAASAERKAAPKPVPSFLTAVIEAIDEAQGTLKVKSRKGIVKEFVADEKARGQMKSLKVGDRVVVKHADGTALSIVKPGAKKKEVPPKEAAAGDPKAPRPAEKK